jgi:hypothetical protein
MLDVTSGLLSPEDRMSGPIGHTREVSARVLVIEYEVEMADAVAVGLRREQIAIDVALDGRVVSNWPCSTITTQSCSTATYRTTPRQGVR